MTDSAKPPFGRRMKAHAPPPPRAPQPAPRHIFRNTDGGGTSGMDAKENMLRPTVDFKLTLPQGYQTSVTEDGSKALMDLLVELCSRFHLNPALHTLELLSPEGHSLGFKPNALLGSLNVACVFIKEKVWEDKVVRRPAPKVPEKTVRLLVNYHGSQKAVLRVNPLVPLEALTPVICDKCEFDPSHVLLLKDGISRQKLPLDKSLTELGIKELYVHDKSLDSLYSSTTSLGKSEKKGLLGIFQFSRKKSKKTSVDMDECDDNVFQNTDTQTNGLSKVSGVPSTLGQSQSVMNMSRMSPKADIKKRQAPVPPEAPATTTGHGFEAYQMGLGSESQQRKRKAPAPPPTPSSITPGSDDTSASAPRTPDTTEISIQALPTRMAESVHASSTIVVMQTVKPVPMKTSTQPNPPTTNSPTSTSSTSDSLAYQDSNSELSHSLDDSDADQDQAGSHCSSVTSSSASGSVQLQPITKSSVYRLEESEKLRGMAAKSNQEVNSASSSRSETESASSLKLDEAENNRHSAIAWLHSMRSSAASGHKANTEAPEEETVSLGSSSGSSSLPDQGYAASEGMGEDSGIISSPTDTQPTSPDGSLSPDGSSRGGGERLLGPVRDNSSDSDEGCATWGSRHRHNGINPQAKSGRITDNYEDDPDLTAQLHQTLADFDADLADHKGVFSVKKTMSTNSNDVPVSVVDMDVPVTAIDEVLEDYEITKLENEAKSLTRTKSGGNKGPGLCQQPSMELQKKNNSACTAADSRSYADTKQPSQPEHLGKLQVKMSTRDKEEDKIIETKIKAMGTTDSNGVKEDKRVTKSAVLSNTDMQKHTKSTEIKPDPIKNNDQRKPLLSTAIQRSQRVEEISVYQNNSSLGQITHNVASRFGMKTFTVVPPKPVVYADTRDAAASRIAGAIKIDDQGNMVKVGITQNRAGGASVLGMNGSEESPLLGKAKAFWSSGPERQETAVPLSKGQINKAKENKDGNTWKTTNTETTERKHKPADKIKEETKEQLKDIHVAKEEKLESQTSVSKNTQQLSMKPALSSPVLPDLQTDTSFLKPSRRTSSHYVASAINKYTKKTPANPSTTPLNPDSSAPVKTQTIGFQRSGRSIQVNPHQSFQSSLSDNKKNDSAYKPHTFGPKRSMSYPEYVSDSQRDFGEDSPDTGGFGHCVGSTNGSFNTLETKTAKNKHSQSSGPTQIHVISNNDREDIKPIRPSGTNPTQNSLPRSSSQQSTASKTGVQTNTKDTTKTATHLTRDARPQPSVTVSDSNDISQAATVFGPVKKFRPVICKSVEKETSLHSSLMDAIQTGTGKERLKKISTSADTCTKKLSYVDEENERSALLAAIRGQSKSARLKKTKSEAADELEKFKKEESSADPPPSPLFVSSTSPPVLTPPPPPPPAPMFAPPPPPPILPAGKPRTVAPPSANTAMNPGLAREAMLEAIRSGSAAEKLKKVAVPKKTVQVNGRLGTIQATSSGLPQQ
ncbi:cordon-bleu isoform X2 [Solea senegalensis]|uniref:Cordon-bleu isoform X2 n=1 Tax=Solea senegalensis TaxID=28829 RepID=A0AAV6PQN7_SOLSE|nr:protein cordon-bleu isoform X3 [Solea senegalensis]KAG7475024.1 cordon-bleu isoform X2 [Solea senegalensis]